MRWASRPLIAAAAVAAACGRGPDPVARSIARDLASELGQPIRSVRCRADACVATTAAGLAIPIAVTGAAPVAWTTAELIDPRPLAVEVHAALASIEADQGVDCGALRLAADAGPRIECALAGGGAAFVTIAVDGALDVELAMTPAIAAERRAPTDDDALDRSSRALDTDEAEGADEADDDGAADAGVDGDAGVDARADARRPGPGG